MPTTQLAADMARPPVDLPPYRPLAEAECSLPPPTCANPDFYGDDIWSQVPGAGNLKHEGDQPDEMELPSDLSHTSSATSDSEGSDIE